MRDPHVGTGVSKSGFVDWGRLSTQHVRKEATEPYRAQLRVLDRIRRDFGP